MLYGTQVDEQCSYTNDVRLGFRSVLTSDALYSYVDRMTRLGMNTCGPLGVP
jgi:hypothetical protein